MSARIEQSILDALTDVDMPRLPPRKSPGEHVELAGLRLPVERAGLLVIGSGAAGLRAAVEAKRRGVDVRVLSQSAWGGTSACSGSDKQTLHTANSADRGDDFHAMARALAAGGAMDEDLAYIEAVGSVRMLASLQYLGLPLPQDRYGATLRYQTDHDETGRATSCGPRTSRLMVAVLAREALRLGVPIDNRTTCLRILAAGSGQARRVAGMIAIARQARSAENPLGLMLYLAPALVLAAGGPGELYRDSVYPNGCFGVLGLALEAGIELVNLTESQFGIGTRREGFPWNLSGTYVQAIPHVYSLDREGREHHFLARYYRGTHELASNLFRKGYQWPFHASRMLGYGSSLVDLAIWREMRAGRRVFMDFRRNPEAVAGDEGFSLDGLDEDVASYLGRAGALQDLPIERLAHMNPLAIELYRRARIDLTGEPLEFALNNQHMNGGIAIDGWGRTTLAGVYAAGEAAGSHGVTRPGGSALNAGQVFATRVGEHAAASALSPPGAGAPIAGLEAQIRDLLAGLNPESPLSTRKVRAEIQARMSDHAGMICDAEGVAQALAGATALNAALAREGIAPDRPADAARALQWRQMALASQAVLCALDTYIARGGGSRGARAILDATGDARPSASREPLADFAFRPERAQDRDEQICVRLSGGELRATTRPNRRLDTRARPFFERDWPDWLTGRVFDIDRAQGQPGEGDESHDT